MTPWLAIVRHVLPGAVVVSNTRTVRMLCPFHTERTPSWAAWFESGRFYCHGCQRTGDVAAFIVGVTGTRRVEVPRIIETALAAAAPEQLSLNLGGAWD